MRVLIAEYVCGGGLAGTAPELIPDSLRREGLAMLSALVEDASEVAEVVVPVDPGLVSNSAPGSNVRHVPLALDRPIWPQWIDAAEDCDVAIVVAPEMHGILAKGVAMLRAGGVDVIASSGDFLRVASDKVLTAKTLHAAGVQHPMFQAKGERRMASKLRKADRFVVKPRDGCGTQLIHTFDSYDAALEHLDESAILQQRLPGTPVSVSLIASEKRQLFLPAVAQTFHEGGFSYAGGHGPLCDDHQRRAMALASRTIEAMPPMARGFIGMDLLMGDRPSEDVVIEINPRLTTSYVGLRRMTDSNLAAHMLDQISHAISYQVGVDEVRWTAEGEVSIVSDANTDVERIVVGDSTT